MTCKRCHKGEATFCISCMTDIVEDTDKALEGAEAKIVKFRAALFCWDCGGTGKKGIGSKVYFEGTEYELEFVSDTPCPTCGPLRKSLKEGE